MELIPVLIIMIPIFASMIVYLTDTKYSNNVVFVAQVTLSILAVKYFIEFEGLKEKHLLNLGNWNEVVSIVLRNDKISMLFIFLTILIWWMILIYIWDTKKRDSKFIFLLIFLEGVFLGLLQTNDLFTMFVFIEITTILSSILILYKMDGESVRAGLYYLLFNSVGMMFYLLGMAFIYYSEGTLNIDILTAKINIYQGLNLTNLSYISIMAAVGVKSAFFPVYNWLPKAHSAAPSSISALLSGLLVKSGLYVFIRINSMYGLETFREFFIILGIFTAISGAIFAVSQKDLKQILAFSTISQIGIIMIGLNQLEGETLGGIMHIINHGIFKTLLFLSGGAVVSLYKKRDVTKIRGLLKNYPLLSIFMIVGILSITGMPLFNGYVSKSIIKYGVYSKTLEYLMYFIDILTLTYFIKLSQIFFGEKNINLKNHKLGIYKKIPLYLLSLACIIFGNFYIPIYSLFTEASIKYINLFNISEWLLFGLKAAVAYFLYRIIVKKDYNFIKFLRRTNISFSSTNFLFILFITIMIIWKL